MPPAYWETLEEVSFRTRDDKGKRIPQERLVAQALNLLFAKYNFPVVREGGELERYVFKPVHIPPL
ncbi:hypothetical protein I7G85_31870 [Sinorhizobium meliloti]|nr:hypothetical protein [Sinorhizobium meliloti]